MFRVQTSAPFRAAIVAAIVGAALAVPAASPAAVTVGEDMALDSSQIAGDPCLGPGDANTFASTAVPPGRLLTSPIDGVVVRWSAWVQDGPTSLTFRVLRPAGGGQFTGAGASAPTPSYTGVGTFDSRVPIKAGDYIGVDMPCAGAGYVAAHYFAGAHAAIWAPTLGEAPLAPNYGDPNYSAMVSADVEPDADGDGYGDETQDQCPSNGMTQGACPPAPADITAPAASASFKRSLRLHNALRRGIRGSVGSNEAAEVTARATLGRRAARRLGFKRSLTVARASASLASPGTVALKLEFGRKAKSKLARGTRVKLKLHLSVTDGPGNTANISRRITLIR